MTILDKIVTQRKERLQNTKRSMPVGNLLRTVGNPRSFYRPQGSITLIAECKKASPSKGIFVEQYNPVVIAHEYEQGGADAISVLTEPDFFSGNDNDLVSVRNKTQLPVLRKDFIIDTYQVRESWSLGADAILLIAAILSEDQLKELAACAQEFDLDVLLEVHDQKELEKALMVPVGGIGINARNLKDFSIDMEAVKMLCRQVPDDRIAVAESGMKSAADGKALYDSGFRGFLVGEYFITASKRFNQVREFRDALK